jgi:hypothetical protein
LNNVQLAIGKPVTKEYEIEENSSKAFMSDDQNFVQAMTKVFGRKILYNKEGI